MKNPTPPAKINPQPLDLILDDIGATLKEQLPWLDNTYGKIERLIRSDGKHKNGRTVRVTYPAIYVGGRLGEDYLSMLPDDHLGNYMYCDVTDEEVDHKPRQSRDGKLNVDFVFHWNYEKIYNAEHTGMTIENVKSDIFDAFDKSVFRKIRLRILKFEEGANKIYSGYTHEEIEHQFLMRPFGGVKIKATIYYDNNC